MLWGIVVLIAANAAFIPVQALLFPDTGGFTRTILFVRPQDPYPGYFIIVDEIKPNLPWETGEVLFHGYGALTINGASAVWQDGGVSLNLTVLSPAVTINRSSGQSYHNGIADTLDYVKIRPLQAGPVTVVTLLFPNNGSYPWPAISVSDTAMALMAQIGDHDYLLINKDEGTIVSNTIFVTDAQLFFARANGTAPGIEYAVMKDGTFCTVNGVNAISTPSRTTVAYLNGTGIVAPAASFYDITPATSSQPFTRDLASDSHPYLVVNDTGLPALRARCNGTTPGPWQGWYASLNATAPSLLSIAPEIFTGPQCAILAFVGYVEDNATYLVKAGEVLKSLDTRQNSYLQLIDRGDEVLDFALAFDFTYNSLSAADQQEVTTKLANLTAPLYDQMYIAPENNWRIVMAGGLGMAGLVLNNLDYVARAQERVDAYLKDNVRGNGACYEGQSYMRYALEMGLRFALALRQLGGYNYFANSRVLAGLNFSIYSSTPTGSPPLYEDCTGSTLAQEAIWSCNYVPDAQLAGQLKWYADRNGINGLDPYAICAYTTEIIPIAPPATTTSVAYGDDDYAFLRSGWDTNATYLCLSNKDYLQSHIHYDEDSIELYAYGKKLLANGGYPSFKKAGHAWAISTEAQNTVLIGGRGQTEQRSNGLNPALLTGVADLVSGDAYLCYRHPFSFAAVPGFLGAYITLIALGIAILIYIRRINHPRIDEPSQSPETPQPASPAVSAGRVLKGSLFPPSFDYCILTSPVAKKSSRVSFLLACTTNIVLLEGIIIALAVALRPFIAEYTNSAHYTSLISLYNTALILLPILLVGIGFLVTWGALRMRRRIYRSLIRPQNDAQDRNINTLLKASLIYSVFIVAVTLAFLAWSIAPSIEATVNAAITRGGEVKEVIQYFIVFLEHGVILLPVIFVVQFVLRMWQAVFLGQGLQSASLLDNTRLQDYRRAVVIPLLVTLIVWIIILTIMFAGMLGLMGFLDTLTIESF